MDCAGGARNGEAAREDVLARHTLENRRPLWGTLAAKAAAGQAEPEAA